MKKRYKCAVDGVLGPNALCGKSLIGTKYQCGAHGNTKCEHKRDRNWTKEKQQEAPK